MTAPETEPGERRRWLMLALVGGGFLVMTLNWFVVSSAFTGIGAELRLDLPSLTLLISVFVAGYGICHIPGGLLATRIGMRGALVAGLALEGLATVASAVAVNELMLQLARIAAGIGASVYAAVGVGAVSVWFRERQLALALGLSAAGFNIGAALGTYAWTWVIQLLGWRGGIAIAGILGCLLAIATAWAFRTPPHAGRLGGVHLSRRNLAETIGNRALWLYGAGFLGAYGGFFAAAQLITTYADTLGYLRPGEAAVAGALPGLAGIPGSIAGGWLSDRLANRYGLVCIAAVAEGISLIAVTTAGSIWFSLAAFGIGFFFGLGSAVWQTLPASGTNVSAENIATAFGLMLTIAAIGGFVLPYVFGLISTASGFHAGWLFLGVVSAATAGIGLFAARKPRNPEPVPLPGKTGERR